MTTENERPGINSIIVERGVPIPMRDGTILKANMYRPAAAGRYPVIVERVAYELERRCRANGEFYAHHGYVFLGQNVRGRFDSEGRFDPLRDDAWGINRDGYDTVEWCGVQPWSNGNVGMMDGSYSGMTQYLLLPTRPPHLRALYIREGAADIYQDLIWPGGTHFLFLRDWGIQQTLAQLRHESVAPEDDPVVRRLEKAQAEISSWNTILPLDSFVPLEGLADWYFEWLAHPEDGWYWRPLKLSLKHADVDTPVLHLSGWFDVFLESSLRSFAGIRKGGRSRACREGQRLVVGPWIHGPENVGMRLVSELDFGAEAEFDLHADRLRWYDHWLNGIDNDVMDRAPVRIFLMGANRWLDFESWPPPDAVEAELFFRAARGGDGPLGNERGLSTNAPKGAESADSFEYDPARPTPSLHRGLDVGPKDHRPIEDGILTYTSEPLQEDLVAIGPVRAVLFAMSSAADTDWVVRLCDVWPDGRVMSVCDGILRARYRNSLGQPELMQPGTIYEFDVSMKATAQVFAAGHRIRVHVASSEFPRYDRNLNTGERIGEGVKGVAAVNTVFHDRLRPSHILMSVVPAGWRTNVGSDT